MSTAFAHDSLQPKLNSGVERVLCRTGLLWYGEEIERITLLLQFWVLPYRVPQLERFTTPLFLLTLQGSSSGCVAVYQIVHLDWYLRRDATALAIFYHSEQIQMDTCHHATSNAQSSHGWAQRLLPPAQQKAMDR